MKNKASDRKTKRSDPLNEERKDKMQFYGGRVFFVALLKA